MNALKRIVVEITKCVVSVDQMAVDEMTCCQKN